MKKGTRVSWRIHLPSDVIPRSLGHGTVITDEEDGKVLVAVDSLQGESNPGYHIVICCTVTWLTVEPN